MSDNDKYIYRANDELAAAVREHLQQEESARREVMEWDESHPGTPVAWADVFGRTRAVGFMDNCDEPPEGLSRAKRRTTLIPKKSKAGRAWQDTLNRFNNLRPQAWRLFDRFGVEFEHRTYIGDGRFRASYTRAYGLREHGVFVERVAPLDPVPDCLTPVPLSEFYAAKEAAEAERVA